MESKAHALAAGLFTVILFAAAILAAMWLSGETYEKAHYMLESKHPITGLSEQAIVRFRGVDVGRVTDIKFDPAGDRVILITVGVQADTPITRGTYAEVRPQGVTGISYIMLDDAAENSEPLPPMDKPGSTRIQVRRTLLETLLAQGKEALGDLRLVSKRIVELLSEENQAQVTATLAGLRKSADQLATLTAAAEPAVRNMGPLTDEARRTLDSANALMTDLSAATKDLAGRAEAIERAAASGEQAAGSVRKLADAALTESLPRINNLVDQLSHTSRNLDRFVTDVKQQPQSLVFGRKPPQPGPGEPGFDGKRTR